MAIIKKIIFWFFFSIIGIISLSQITNLSGIFGILALILLLPIKKWQDFLGKFFKKPIKIAVIIVLIGFMFGFIPTNDSPSNTDTSSQIISQEQTASDVQATNKDKNNISSSADSDESSKTAKEESSQENSSEKIDSSTQSSTSSKKQCINRKQNRYGKQK